MNVASQPDPEQVARNQAERESQEKNRLENSLLPDDNGISSAMIDLMVNTIAEGLATGLTDMRGLCYCAYRNARNQQKLQEQKKET